MTMYRKHTIDAASLRQATDSEDRIISMAFSSEAPYERWWGIEVLDHSASSVRLDRLNDGASVLFNHDWNDLRGAHVPGTTRIDGDRVLRGDVRLTAATQPGRDAIALVESGVLTKASTGYQIHRVIEQTTTKQGETVERELDGALFERVLERAQQEHRGDLAAFRRALDAAAGKFERADDAPTIYRVIDWEPFENSLVTVPADPSVGVGRMAEQPGPRQGITAAARSTGATIPAATAAVTQGVKQMSDINTAAAGPSAEQANDGTMIERLRLKTITDLCRQHKVDDKTRDSWIDGGITVDVASSKVLDIIAERGRNNPGTSAGNLDLSTREVQQFSLMKAIVAARDKDWSKAGFEAECSRAISQRLGVVPDSTRFYVPLDVQRRPLDPKNTGRRDMTVASASGGGYLVGTDNQGFIDLLRNRSVAFAMGARRLSGLVGNLTVPKLTTGATAYWLATESTSITEGAQVLGQLSLSPKTVGAYVEISRQLALQSTPDAEQMVMSDLAAQTALAVDAAVLAGAGGSGEPQGIIGLSGVGTFTGTSLDYAALLNAQADVAAANALTETCGYVFTPAVAALLMARVKYSNTASPLWDGNMLKATCAGFKGMSSNQVPSAKGIFGDWQQVIVGEWGILQVEVNPYANFAAGIMGVRAMYSVDVGVRYAAAFSTTSSIT